jgi:hypothetical protein
MYYKGQTVLVSYVDEGEEDVKEMPAIYLGINKDGEPMCYYGKTHEQIIETCKPDVRAIGDPSKDGGVYWGKFRTNSIAGIMTAAAVVKNFKDWNKELTNVKRMLTNRNKKKK